MASNDSHQLHRLTRAPFTPKAPRGPFRTVSIATTEVCNLSCVFCHFNGPHAVKKDKQLSPELVAEALRELPRGSEIHFAATGEFFMDPHALHHLHEAIRLGLSPLVLTHGQLFSKELLD